MASEKILESKQTVISEISDKVKILKALFYLDMLKVQLLIYKD